MDALLLLGSWVDAGCRRARDGAIVLEVNREPRHWYFLHDVHPRSIAARLRRWVESTETRVVLREQWREFPTTWNAVQKLADEFAARPGALFTWVNREDLTRLLALRAFVMQARSHDVVGTAGESVSVQQVVAWLRQALAPEEWPIVTDMTGPLKNQGPPTIRSREPMSPDSDSSATTLRDSRPPMTAIAHPGISSASARSRALRTLEHLRVASLERLVREAARIDSWVTRKHVVDELQALGPRIRWFGRAIVALLPEDSP